MRTLDQRHGSDRPAGHPEHRGAPDLVARRQPRELQLDEVEIVLKRVEVAAKLIGLAQASAGALVWIRGRWELGYLRPEARDSFLRSAGAVLYFDNSSAVARSITNQVRRRKSLESLSCAISRFALGDVMEGSGRVGHPLGAVCRDQVVDLALCRAGEMKAHVRSPLGCRTSVLPQVQRVFVWHAPGMPEEG